MKLYCFPVAPNPTKVRLYLAEKTHGGAEMNVEEVTVNLAQGEHKNPEHLQRNPFGRLPVLELDDGSYLGESLAIIQYLEELYPSPTMIGEDPRERARVRALERIAELDVLGVIARVVHSTNSPLGLPPNPAMAEHFSARLPAALGYWENLLGDGRPFLAGDHPTITDCTMQAAFQFARFGKLEIDPALGNLARWDAAFRARPSAQTVLLA